MPDVLIKAQTEDREAAVFSFIQRMAVKKNSARCPDIRWIKDRKWWRVPGFARLSVDIYAVRCYTHAVYMNKARESFKIKGFRAFSVPCDTEMILKIRFL